MKNPYHKAHFLTSAAKLSQLPEGDGMEVAFVGRSNVGKSSALNALTQQKSLARTSKTPGRTQLINLFSIDDQRRLVDLPGYGYAKVSEAMKREWQKTLQRYLEERDILRGLVVLVDIRHPLKEVDFAMVSWAVAAELPVHVLCNKADKLSRNQVMRAVMEFQKMLPESELISIQAFSAQSKEGLSGLVEQLNGWFEL